MVLWPAAAVTIAWIVARIRPCYILLFMWMVFKEDLAYNIETFIHNCVQGVRHMLQNFGGHPIFPRNLNKLFPLTRAKALLDCWTPCTINAWLPSLISWCSIMEEIRNIDLHAQDFMHSRFTHFCNLMRRICACSFPTMFRRYSFLCAYRSNCCCRVLLYLQCIKMLVCSRYYVLRSLHLSLNRMEEQHTYTVTEAI